MTTFKVWLRVECSGCESAWWSVQVVRCRNKIRAEKAAVLRERREMGADFVCFDYIEAEWVEWK